MAKLKKGVTWGMVLIVSLLILAVGIILFFPFIQALMQYITGGGESAACTLSLLKGKGTAKCPVDKVGIKKDKVEINDKEFLTLGDRGTQNMAKEALARLLVKCLNSGGGYNSKSFSGDNYVSDEVVCLECYKVHIDKSVGDLGSFIDYLRDVKIKGDASGKVYLDALTRDPEHLRAYMEYGMARRLAPSTGSFVFSPDKDYVIFFMGVKHGEIINIWGKVKNAANAEFLKFFFGNNDAYFAYVVEFDRVNEVCQRKVN